MIYILTLKEPIDGKDTFHSYSIKGFYEVLTHKEIGCKVDWLWKCKITPKNKFVGRKCTIKAFEDPIRSKQKKK